MNNANVQYKPLRVDTNIDSANESILDMVFKTINSLHEKIPIFPYRYKTIRTRQIEVQLKSRKHFPRAEWENIIQDTDKVKKILKIIIEWIGWPNYNFIPTDLIRYALYCDFEEYILHDITKAINKALGGCCDEVEIFELGVSNKSLKDLILYILVKQNKTSDVSD